MDVKDFDNLVTDGQIDTDSILKIRDAIVDMNTTIDGLNSDIAQHKQRISDLIDTNSKLYLRVTNGQTTMEQTEDVLSVDDILKKWR